MGWRHALELRKHPICQVAAIADARYETAKACAREVKAEPFQSAEKMLEELIPDFAVIATPDDLHRNPTLACIRAGVPTIVLEKPLTTSLEEGLELVREAKQAGTRVLMNFSNRMWPAERATRMLVSENVLGVPVCGRIYLDDNIGVPQRLWGERSAEWSRRSSTIHFLFPHLIDLLRYYQPGDRIARVFGKSVAKTLPDTQDAFLAILEWESGTVMQLEANWVKHIPHLVEFQVELVLSEGTIVHNRFPAFRSEAGWTAMAGTERSDAEIQTLQERCENFGLHTRQIRYGVSPAPDHQATILPSWCLEQTGTEPFTDMHVYADAVVHETLTPPSWQGSGPLPSLEDGWEALRVVEAIRRSIQSRWEIALDDTGPAYSDL